MNITSLTPVPISFTPLTSTLNRVLYVGEPLLYVRSAVGGAVSRSTSACVTPIRPRFPALSVPNTSIVYFPYVFLRSAMLTTAPHRPPPRFDPLIVLASAGLGTGYAMNSTPLMPRTPPLTPLTSTLNRVLYVGDPLLYALSARTAENPVAAARASCIFTFPQP